VTATVSKLAQVRQDRAANGVRRETRRGQMVENRPIIWRLALETVTNPSLRVFGGLNALPEQHR